MTPLAASMDARVGLVAVMLVASAFAGCMQGGDGSASVYVKDAPTDEFQEIHVVFSEVYVHEGGEDGDENETEDGADGQDRDGGQQGGPSDGDVQTAAQHTSRQFNEDAGWIQVAGEGGDVDVDLLNATGTRAAFLGEANLSAGLYTQIAIVVQDAYGIDNDGERVEITVPSGVGRVVRSFNVSAGEETRIIMDLELDRAMTEANGEWKLTPVFGKTVVEQVDDSESGADAHEPGENADVGEGS